MSIYEQYGYKGRRDYLQSLAKENYLELWEVCNIAEMLGPDEDFDGLIISVQDYAYFKLING